MGKIGLVRKRERHLRLGDTTNDTERSIRYTSVSSREAAEDICGISVKGFVVEEGRGQYRACKDTAEDTSRKQDNGYRKRYILLKKTRH